MMRLGRGASLVPSDSEAGNPVEVPGFLIFSCAQTKYSIWVDHRFTHTRACEPVNNSLDREIFETQ